MNRVKTGFCLFLFILSCFYFKDIFKDLDLVDLILNKSKNLSISKIISNKDIEEPVSLLDLNDKTVPLNIEKDLSITKKTDNSPKVYIFNTVFHISTSKSSNYENPLKFLAHYPASTKLTHV